MAEKVTVVDGFRAGEVLTADALNAIEARVAELRARVAHCFAGRHTHLLPPRGFLFGFRVCVRAGTLMVRMGLIDWGGGVFERVGARVPGTDDVAEWTPLGPFEAGKAVWLEMKQGASRVVLKDVKADEFGGGKRRRLAVVLADEDGSGMRLLQLTGGVQTPALVRGRAGSPGMWQGLYDGSYAVRAEDDGRVSAGWVSAGVTQMAVQGEEEPVDFELTYGTGEPGMLGFEYEGSAASGCVRMRPMRSLTLALQGV